MHIFLVDDHPMTVDGFQSILLKDKMFVNPTFTSALDATTAYQKIQIAVSENRKFDVAILDYSIPPDPENNIFFGSDLVLLLQKIMPNCKTIMVTAHTEKIVVYNIAKKINPNGFLIKNDVTPENLIKAVSIVISNQEYRSPMVLKCITEMLENNMMMDDVNRQILTYMSKGYKIKDLEAVLHISKSAIEKRVSKLKDTFDVKDDNSLLQQVIFKGFI